MTSSDRFKSWLEEKEIEDSRRRRLNLPTNRMLNRSRGPTLFLDCNEKDSTLRDYFYPDTFVTAEDVFCPDDHLSAMRVLGYDVFKTIEIEIQAKERAHIMMTGFVGA